jgi:DNA-binding NarL/FixJ family response regulator
MIRVAILCTHTLLNSLLSRFFAQADDLSVAAATRTAGELVDAVRANQVDVVLLDVESAQPSPVEAIRSVKTESPSTEVIAFCECAHDVYAVRAVRAGARGFVNAEITPDELLMAIRTVAVGKSYIAGNVTGKLTLETLGVSQEPHTGLSDREFEVLLLLADGKSTAEIAELLHLSESTVATHRSGMLRKLGLRSSAEAVRYAIEHKLLP